MTVSTDKFDWDRIEPIEGISANPAAGADITITVPAGERWLFLGAAAQCVNDANAANRYVYLEIRPDGTNPTERWFSGNAFTAGLTGDFAFSRNGTQGLLNVGGVMKGLVSIPNNGIELPPGAVIIITCFNKEAGDDWGPARYQYKKLVR